jgi:hypothetical protein
MDDTKNTTAQTSSQEVRKKMRSFCNKRRVFMILIAAILVFSANFALSNARARKEDNMVPFKANAKAYAVVVSPPPILEIYITGNGHATHMGNIRIWQHHFVNVLSMTFYDGVFVWTAANGDTISGGYYGSMVPTSTGFEIHGYFTIDGGTGRFENAEGGGVASGMQYFDNTADLRLDGTITSVGSR